MQPAAEAAAAAAAALAGAAAAVTAAAKALSDPGTSSLERWQKLEGVRRARSGLTQVGSTPPQTLQGGLGSAVAWRSASDSAQPPAAGQDEADVAGGPSGAEAEALQQQVPQVPGHTGQAYSSRERIVPEPVLPLPPAGNPGVGAVWAAPDACSCSDEEEDQCSPSGPAVHAAKRRKALEAPQPQPCPREALQRKPGTAAPAAVMAAEPGLPASEQQQQPPQRGQQAQHGAVWRSASEQGLGAVPMEAPPEGGGLATALQLLKRSRSQSLHPTISKGGSAMSLGASGEGGSSSLAASRQRKRVRYLQPVSATLEADLQRGGGSADGHASHRRQASGSTGPGGVVGGEAQQPQQAEQAQQAQDAQQQGRPSGEEGTVSSERAGGGGSDGNQDGTATGPTSLGVGGSRRGSGNGSGSGEGSNEQPQAGQATEAGGGAFTTAGGGGTKASGQQGSGGNSSGTDRRPHGNTNSQADSMYKPGATTAAQQAAVAEQQYYAACERQEAAEHYYYAAQKQKRDASNQLVALAAAASAAANAAEAAATAANAGVPAAAGDGHASPKGSPSVEEEETPGLIVAAPAPAAPVMPPPATVTRPAATGAPAALPGPQLQHRKPGSFAGRNPGTRGPATAGLPPPLPPPPPRRSGPARASRLAAGSGATLGLGLGTHGAGPYFAQMPPWLPAAPPQYGQPPWHHPNPAEDASHKLGYMHQFYAQARDAFLGQVMEIMHSVQVMGQHQVQACAVQGADAQAIVRACNKAMEIVQSFSGAEAPALPGVPGRGPAAPAVPFDPSRLPGISSEHPSSLFPASLCGPSGSLPTAFANASGGRFEGASGAGLGTGTLPSAGGSTGHASRAGSLLPPAAPAGHAAARLATAGSGLLLAGSSLAAPAGAAATAAAAVPGSRLPITPALAAGPPTHAAGAAAAPRRSVGPAVAAAGPIPPKGRPAGAASGAAGALGSQGIAQGTAFQIQRPFKDPAPAATAALPAAQRISAGPHQLWLPAAPAAAPVAAAAAQGRLPGMPGQASAFGLAPPTAPLLLHAQSHSTPPLGPAPEAAAAAAAAAAVGLAPPGYCGFDALAAAAAGVAGAPAGYSGLRQSGNPPGLAAALLPPGGEPALPPNAAAVALALSLQAQQAQHHAAPQLAALPMGLHAPPSTAGIAPAFPCSDVLAAAVAAAGCLGAGASWPTQQQLQQQW